MAEWTMISWDDEITNYADKTSISRNGNKARIWTMNDFKSTQNTADHTFLSMVKYHEYDCKSKMVNLLHLNAYSKNMGEGIVVVNIKYDDKDWQYIAPNTISEASWKTACGKK